MLPAGGDPGDRVVGELRPFHRRERPIRVGDVEEMMRHAAALLERRLGRPQIHPAVDLGRVGVDDLAPELPRERDRDRRLPRRRRTADDQELRWTPI